MAILSRPSTSPLAVLAQSQLIPSHPFQPTRTSPKPISKMSAIKKQPAESAVSPEGLDCIKVALALARSEKSIRTLEYLGTLISTKFKSAYCDSHPDHGVKIEKRVKNFLDQLGSNEQLGNIELTTSKHGDCSAWFKPASRSEQARDWWSYAAGTMYLREAVCVLSSLTVRTKVVFPCTNQILGKDITAMALVKRTEPTSKIYAQLIFKTGRAVARAIVHCFFCTLVKPEERHYFEKLDLANFWEEGTIGGQLVVDADPRPGSVDRTRQSLDLTDQHGTRRWRIKLPENLGESIPYCRFPKPRCRLARVLTWLAKSLGCPSRPSTSRRARLPLLLEVVLPGRAAVAMLRVPQTAQLAGVLFPSRPPRPQRAQF